MAASWTDQEPGLREAWTELARMTRRAWARSWITLLLAVVVVGVFITRKALTPPMYPATLVLRVTETGLETAKASPRTAGRLKEYVTNAVFSDRALLTIMERHDLEPSLRKRNTPLAIDEFRGSIEVDVSRNHFIDERQRGDPPRSARVALGYTTTTPQRALAVVRDLGDLIVSYEASRRTDQLFAASRFQAQLAEQLDGEISARERQIAANLTAAIGPSGVPADIGRLVASLNRLRLERRDIGKQREDVELLGALERQQSGLKFERVDWHAEENPMSNEQRLMLAAAIAFLITLPLCALAVGAFGSRVYDPDDIRRLGIHPLGLMHVFPRQVSAAAAARTWKRAPTA